MMLVYWLQPSSVVLYIQKQRIYHQKVSMGLRPHLWVFSLKTAPLAPELQVSLVSSSHLWFSPFTTATL